MYTGDGVKEERIKEDKSKGDKNDSVARLRFLGKLGLEGWELVSIQGVGWTRVWYFKRPLPE